MNLNIDWTVIGIIASFIVLLYAFGKLLLKPLRGLLHVIGSALLGGSFIGIVNLIGAGLNFYIPPNPVTYLIAGLLGLPGLIVLYLSGLVL